MSEPAWISEKLVVAIHGDQVAKHGGLDGLRDANLLDASLARPRHLWTYVQPDLFELAAAYGYGLTKNHPFVDGNKRTAFMERLASSILTQGDLAVWLKQNSRSR